MLKQLKDKEGNLFLGTKNISNKNLISYKLAVDIISLKALQNIRFFIYQ